MSEPLRVLQIEDSEDDAALNVRLLHKGGYEVHPDRVEDAAEMRAALERQAWDVILADYCLPQFDAPGALRILHETGQDIPFIVVSGTIGEDVAVEMMKAGAHDYLLKNNLTRLVPAVKREIMQARMRSERRQAARALRQSELVNVSHDAIITANPNRVITTWNIGAEEIYGWNEAEAVGNVMHQLFQTTSPVLIAEIDEILAREGHWDGELVQTRRDGREVIVDSRQVLQRDAAALPIGILAINRDITERKRMEERLRHAQKLESIGLLAGGVAHDFNNLLTVILGNATAALGKCPTCEHSEAIVFAAERAAKLTKQLLAYAGKGQFVKTAVDISNVVSRSKQLLGASVPKRVNLVLNLSHDLPAIEEDPSRVEQILMNLVINAGEAMAPKSDGRIEVSTGLSEITPDIARQQSRYEVVPGTYVWLKVRDNGGGMDEATLPRIFDPFFSTKFIGRGLGLAAVDGIVRSSKGFIEVRTLPGEGATFRVFLPATANRLAPSVDASPEGQPHRALPTVLVVDDEEMVRQLEKMILRGRGYEVLEATDGKHALQVLAESPSLPTVVLLDLAMPVMGGDELVHILAERYPSLKVIIISGYPEQEARKDVRNTSVAGFLQKPYSAVALTDMIDEVLGREPQQSGRFIQFPKVG